MAPDDLPPGVDPFTLPHADVMHIYSWDSSYASGMPYIATPIGTRAAPSSAPVLNLPPAPSKGTFSQRIFAEPFSGNEIADAAGLARAAYGVWARANVEYDPSEVAPGMPRSSHAGRASNIASLSEHTGLLLVNYTVLCAWNGLLAWSLFSSFLFASFLPQYGALLLVPGIRCGMFSEVNACPRFQPLFLFRSSAILSSGYAHTGVVAVQYCDGIPSLTVTTCSDDMCISMDDVLCRRHVARRKFRGQLAGAQWRSFGRSSASYTSFIIS